jgi:Transcriptional regulators
MAMDEHDLAILSFLQKNNKISQKDLARQVNLSVSAVSRRIGALEDAGVIRENVSVLDQSMVGRSITIIVEIEIADERLDLLEEDKKRFLESPYVQQVYYVTGEFDFLLVLAMRDMAEYEALTRTLFFTSKNIKRFRTIVAMQNVKQTFALPLP